MGENESKFNPIKIEETMKKTFYIVIAIIIIFIIFLLILSIFVIPQLGPQNALIANSVIWSISIVVILIISCFLRSFLKLRSFELTENYILFQSPYSPEFKIPWKEINKISVKEKMIYVGKVRRKFFKITFHTKEGIKEFKAEPSHDYRLKRSKAIFEMLHKKSRLFDVGFEEEA